MDTAGTPFGVKRRRPGAAALVEQGYGPGSMPTYQP
jgi:hypothetical protein